MNEQMNVPKLRFVEFEGGWDKVTLGQLSNSIKSGKSKSSTNGQYDLYGSTGIIGTTDLASHSGKYILVARVGANAGTLNEVEGDFGVSDNTLIIETKLSSSLTFIKYSLINFNLNRLIFGSGQPLITGGDLKAHKMAAPAFPEQQKIASFLSKVDEKIALLTEKKAKLAEYKKGVMQQLFDGSWQQHDGKLVFVPPTLRFKADDGSEFPDWEEVSLGSITTAMQSGISRQLHSEDIGYPILRSNNMSEGKVSFEDLKYWHLTDDQGADLTRYILEEGDLLVNFINSLSQIGKVAVYYNSMGRDVIYTTNIMRLKFNSMITSEFAFYSFNTRRYVNFIQSIAKPAVSQASFTTVDFKKYKMHVPTRAEQNKMTSMLLAIDQKIELTNSELDKAKEWKKGLLQQMFV